MEHPLKTTYAAGRTAPMPYVDQVLDISEARFKDSIDDFRKLHASDSITMERLRNRVKVCGQCTKPCAYTLTSCNACGSSLETTEVSYNDNCFMGFIYGIAKGRFPYTISMRAQTPDFLCFDDPLACSACHLNSIPTSVYVPDCRFLFADPPRGLKLINDMFDTAAKVALEQFWGNEEYHRTVLGGAPKPKDTEELKEYVILGMNFPPSMFQIHLQFIHFPLLPFHDSQLQKGEHFTYRRFFPLGYLQKALALGDAVKMENVTMETDLETILEKVKAAGVDYDVFHAAQIKKAHGLQNRLAGTAWKEDCFAYRVHGDQVTEKGRDGNFEVKPDMCSKEVQKGDAKALQNYGRPYKDDKPTGTYYKYAKEPKDVIGFCDVSR
eukprot:CAMPEP_0115131550 /NCGR_PEP_ID=MMETSP0227-20121206/53194_1 /TAXON_ID=89957 /ORGANISM="Polarella glacialis, Strain CCMP 1383" /LENGTH=380 /DNA_ID=CAMNT_0002537113 /DNA_START=175 /DNA_END=1317 /DNA_ORIENTATION=+